MSSKAKRKRRNASAGQATSAAHGGGGDRQTAQARVTMQAQAALDIGDVQQAVAICERAMAEGEEQTEAAVGLGEIYLQQDQPDRALEPLREACRQRPEDVSVMGKVADALMRLGRWSEAAEMLDRAVTLQPGQYSLRWQLMDCLFHAGRWNDALNMAGATLDDDSIPPGNLAQCASLLGRHRQLELAERCLRTSLEREESPSIMAELALVLQKRGQLSESLALFQQAMNGGATHPVARMGYATTLARLGDIEGACDAFRQAMNDATDEAVQMDAHQGLLFNLHYLPSPDRKELFEEHVRWGRNHAPAGMARQEHDRDLSPNRRLRIGYVSPDFRAHSVAWFFESILDGRDQEQVEVFCYSDLSQEDSVTQRLKDKCDAFQNVAGWSDGFLAERIDADGIDILVDLAGHTQNGRPRVLALKPAPVEVTYLGYPDTTGIEAVDYRLTDEWADPPENQEFCVEELAYMPEGFLCYRPQDNAPAVTEPPMGSNGYVTFGSFNNGRKITPLVCGLWAQVLHANEGSRLLLKFPGGDDPQCRQRILDDFETLGIDPSRIELYGKVPAAEHLAMYSRVDVALDTYPYHGTTTTCEALWMGVPVVTLAGELHASRVGLSIMTRLGLGVLVATSPEEYVLRASALANDPEALRQLRTSMRDRMRASGLCDPQRFCRDLQDVYRAMWHRYCASQGVDVDSQTPPTQPQPQNPNGISTDHERIPAESPAAADDNAPLGRLEEMAVLADGLWCLGRSREACMYAIEGLQKQISTKQQPDLPAELLEQWRSTSARTFFVEMLVSSLSTSSFFARDNYRKLLDVWVSLDETSGEAKLRRALLAMYEADRAGQAIPAEAIQWLTEASETLEDPRAAEALKLASGKGEDLVLPWEQEATIVLEPRIQNGWTYMTLELGDGAEPELPLWRDLIQPGMRVLDIGAGAGWYSLSAALRVGPEGQVLAVDPDEQTVARLERSAEDLESMNVLQAAVSDSCCDGELANGRSVTLMHVDAISAQLGGVDLIRLNARQQERAVLQGAEQTNAQTSPMWLVEYRPGQPERDITADLQAAGYRLWVWSSGRGCLRAWQPEMEIWHPRPYLLACRDEQVETLRELVPVDDATAND